MSSDAIDETMKGLESELMQGLADKAVEAEAALHEDVLVGPEPEPEPEVDPFRKMAEKFWASWKPADGHISLSDFVAGEMVAAAEEGLTITVDEVRDVLAGGGIKAFGTNMHVMTEIGQDVWINAHIWVWEPERSLVYRKTDEPPLWLKVQIVMPEDPELPRRIDAPDFDDNRGGILESIGGQMGDLARSVDHLINEFRADRIERTKAMETLVGRLETALKLYIDAKAKEQS